MRRMHGLLVAMCAVAPASAQIIDSPDEEVAGIPVNYTESKVGIYTLPELLVLNDGQPVKDAKTWVEKARFRNSTRSVSLSSRKAAMKRVPHSCPVISTVSSRISGRPCDGWTNSL